VDFRTRANAAWWDALLDGQPHDVDIRETTYHTVTLLRAAVYRQAEAFNRVARSKQLGPYVLRIQVWKPYDQPGRGQIEGEPQPLPLFERSVPELPSVDPAAEREVIMVLKAVVQYQDACAAAGKPVPSTEKLLAQLYAASRSTSGQ
jgi:hypothetical protein